MPPFYINGGGKVFHHCKVAAPHVPPISLEQKGFRILSSGEAGPVIEDTAVPAVSGIPFRIILSLRVGKLGIVSG